MFPQDPGYPQAVHEAHEALHAPRQAPAGPPRAFDPHPLFPRADGSAEDQDIRFVTFLRRVDGAIKHCPEDIARDQVQSWDQVTDWWGGGEYQAIAKDGNHIVLRHHPNKAEWVDLDGPPLPFVKRGARQAAAAQAARAPEQAALPAAASVSPGVADVLGKLLDRLDRMEQRFAVAPQGGSEVMVAMINAQATRDAATAQAQASVAVAEAKARGEALGAEARARADAQIAQAKATADNNQFLLGVLSKGGDGTSQFASMLGLLKPYLKPEAPPDSLAVLREVKQMGLLGGAADSEFKPLAETFGHVMTQKIAADGKARVAEAEVRKEEIRAGRPPEGPPRRDREREPPLRHIPGVGMVHVVAAELAPPVPAPPAPVAVAAPAAPEPAASAPAPAFVAPPGPPVAVPVASSAPPAPPPPAEPAAPPGSHLRLVPPLAEPPPAPAASAAPTVELPAEVRSVIETVAAEMSFDDMAAITGAMGRLKGMPDEARIPLIQRFFPTLDDKEAAQWGHMIDEMPMFAIHGLVEQLKPAELKRIKHLNGFNPPEG